MKIAFVASEAVPFANSGALRCGRRSGKTLVARGLEVIVAGYFSHPDPLKHSTFRALRRLLSPVCSYFAPQTAIFSTLGPLRLTLNCDIPVTVQKSLCGIGHRVESRELWGEGNHVGYRLRRSL